MSVALRSLPPVQREHVMSLLASADPRAVQFELDGDGGGFTAVWDVPPDHEAHEWLGDIVRNPSSSHSTEDGSRRGVRRGISTTTLHREVPECVSVPGEQRTLRWTVRMIEDVLSQLCKTIAEGGDCGDGLYQYTFYYCTNRFGLGALVENTVADLVYNAQRYYHLSTACELFTNFLTEESLTGLDLRFFVIARSHAVQCSTCDTRSVIASDGRKHTVPRRLVLLRDVPSLMRKVLYKHPHAAYVRNRIHEWLESRHSQGSKRAFPKEGCVECYELLRFVLSVYGQQPPEAPGGVPRSQEARRTASSTAGSTRGAPLAERPANRTPVQSRRTPQCRPQEVAKPRMPAPRCAASAQPTAPSLRQGTPSALGESFASTTTAPPSHSRDTPPHPPCDAHSEPGDVLLATRLPQHTGTCVLYDTHSAHEADLCSAVDFDASRASSAVPPSDTSLLLAPSDTEPEAHTPAPVPSRGPSQEAQLEENLGRLEVELTELKVLQSKLKECSFPKYVASTPEDASVARVREADAVGLVEKCIFSQQCVAEGGGMQEMDSVPAELLGEGGLMIPEGHYDEGLEEEEEYEEEEEEEEEGVACAGESPAAECAGAGVPSAPLCPEDGAMSSEEQSFYDSLATALQRGSAQQGPEGDGDLDFEPLEAPPVNPMPFLCRVSSAAPRLDDDLPDVGRTPLEIFAAEGPSPNCRG